jgi:hypothetical protein
MGDKGKVISLCDHTGRILEPWAEAGFECNNPYRTTAQPITATFSDLIDPEADQTPATII